MKRFYKIIATALLGLTISALLAFGASAEDAPIIERKAAKFDDGEITLTFAAKSDASSLKIKIWETYPIADTPVLYETAEFTEMTLDGESYKVFSSENVLLQNLRKSYYAAIYSLDASGNEISHSEITSFSVFDYFLELLGTGTEDQIALFTRLLEMGAAMQKQLLGTSLYPNSDFTEAGGYADEYYVLITNTIVDGELKDSTTTYYADPTDTRLKATRVVDGACFAGFSDKDGNALKEYGDLTSSSWNELPYSVTKAGIATINLNYVTGGTLPLNYEKASSISGLGVIKDAGTEFTTPKRVGLTTDKKGVASTTAIAGSAHIAFASKEENKFLGFYKIIKALSATTYADENADKSGAYKADEIINSQTVKDCGMYLPSKDTAEGANVHVFETDLYMYYSKAGTPTYINLLNADGEAFWGFNIKSESAGSTFSLNVRGGSDSGKCFTEGISLRQREWYNLRVEYGFNESDEVEIKVYIDGKLTATYTSPTSADAALGEKDNLLDKVQIYHADGVNNVTLCLDNTLITSVKTN